MQPAFSSRHRTPHSQSGGSLVPVLIVITGLVISTVIFFMFTRKQMGGREAQAAAAVNQAPQSPAGIPSGRGNSPSLARVTR